MGPGALDGLRDRALALARAPAPFAVAVAAVDFASGAQDSFEVLGGPSPRPREGGPPLWFDLASLTKPLTLAAARFAEPGLFGDRELLLLEHRGGLPPWRRLSRASWREDLLAYAVRESPPAYSDLSALRLQLELERSLGGRGLYDVAAALRDPEVRHWTDLPAGARCPPTGTRGGRPVEGAVHDDNAFALGGRLAHAGLFATAGGLARSLLAWDARLGLLGAMAAPAAEASAAAAGGGRRFPLGLEAPSGEAPLAGDGRSPATFGHLGFTGASFWVDAAKRTGLVVLSNACYPHVHDRGRLNALRRGLGSAFWRGPGAGGAHGQDT